MAAEEARILRRYSNIAFIIGVVLALISLLTSRTEPPNVLTALFAFVLWLGSVLCFVIGLVKGIPSYKHQGKEGIWLNTIGLLAVILPVVFLIISHQGASPEGKLSQELIRNRLLADQLLKEAEQGNEESKVRLEKYAVEGLAPARFNLGLMYWSGKAVSQDYIMAYYWIRCAASSSILPGRVKEYEAVLELISRDMTPDQINEAKQLLIERNPKGTRPTLKKPDTNR